MTEAVYYILLSLYEPMHGYGIMQQVKDQSHDRLILGAGTLYGALSTLLEKNWIVLLKGEVASAKKNIRIISYGLINRSSR